MTNGYKEKAGALLAQAGITLNGPAPSDIQVHNERLYERVFAKGSVGLGEAYMDGWWDAEDLAGFFTKVLGADLAKELYKIGTVWYLLQAKLFNRQNKYGSRRVAEEHYDVNDDVYELMLDPYMQYTCGYWKTAKTLNEAQIAKMDLICRKLGLKPGMTLLDIGCGWGGFAKFAAEKYGTQVTGITISKEQLTVAKERTKNLSVEIHFEDYRDTTGQFDRIVSVGMFEHVGHKNYRTYIQKVSDLLKDDGLFLLHTISSHHTTSIGDPWIDKYIFPNGVLPSIAQIGKAVDNLFTMEDWHNFGADYDKTLMAWFQNFDRNWPQLKDKYSERFYRMWKYYLLACAGLFRARQNQLWQIVLSKKGIEGGHATVR